MSGYVNVRRFAVDHRDWLPVVNACLKLARETGPSGFAGRWVLNELNRTGWKGLPYGDTRAQWFPGLKMLERYGILHHENTTRGGRRAYYTMPDPDAVEAALDELGQV